jgi:S1-C subfamily serine protease
MGSPFGERQSLSVGVISGLDRTIQSLTRFQISGAIQTDAAINRGISGGPLLDARGRVVGINAQTSPDGAGGSGVGFAVPIDLVKRSLTQLRAAGKAKYAFVGVSTVPLYPQLARHLGLPVTRGALVEEVVDGGPADDAGIRAGNERIRFQGQPYRTGGDVIVAVAGKPIRRESDVGRVLATHAPGETVSVQVLRGGARRDFRVRLEERP